MTVGNDWWDDKVKLLVKERREVNKWYFQGRSVRNLQEKQQEVKRKANETWNEWVLADFRENENTMITLNNC